MKTREYTILGTPLCFKLSYLPRKPYTKISKYLYMSTLLTRNIIQYFLIGQAALVLLNIHIINLILCRNDSILILSYIRPCDRKDESSVQRSESSLIGEI